MSQEQQVALHDLNPDLRSLALVSLKMQYLMSKFSDNQEISGNLSNLSTGVNSLISGFFKIDSKNLKELENDPELDSFKEKIDENPSTKPIYHYRNLLIDCGQALNTITNDYSSNETEQAYNDLGQKIDELNLNPHQIATEFEVGYFKKIKQQFDILLTMIAQKYHVLKNPIETNVAIQTFNLRESLYRLTRYQDAVSDSGFLKNSIDAGVEKSQTFEQTLNDLKKLLIEDEHSFFDENTKKSIVESFFPNIQKAKEQEEADITKVKSMSPQSIEFNFITGSRIRVVFIFESSEVAEQKKKIIESELKNDLLGTSIICHGDQKLELICTEEKINDADYYKITFNNQTQLNVFTSCLGIKASEGVLIRNENGKFSICCKKETLLKNRLASLEKEYASAKADKSKLYQDLKKLSDQIETVRKQLGMPIEQSKKPGINKMPVEHQHGSGGHISQFYITLSFDSDFEISQKEFDLFFKGTRTYDDFTNPAKKELAIPCEWDEDNNRYIVDLKDDKNAAERFFHAIDNSHGVIREGNRIIFNKADIELKIRTVQFEKDLERLTSLNDSDRFINDLTKFLEELYKGSRGDLRKQLLSKVLPNLARLGVFQLEINSNFDAVMFSFDQEYVELLTPLIEPLRSYFTEQYKNNLTCSSTGSGIAFACKDFSLSFDSEETLKSFRQDAGLDYYADKNAFSAEKNTFKFNQSVLLKNFIDKVKGMKVIPKKLETALIKAQEKYSLLNPAALLGEVVANPVAKVSTEAPSINNIFGYTDNTLKLAEENVEKIKNLEMQLSDANQKISALNAAAAREKTDLSQQIEAQESELKQMEAQQKELSNMIGQLNSNLTKLKDENKIMSDNMENVRSKLGEKENEIEILKGTNRRKITQNGEQQEQLLEKEKLISEQSKKIQEQQVLIDTSTEAANAHQQKIQVTTQAHQQEMQTIKKELGEVKQKLVIAQAANESLRTIKESLDNELKNTKQQQLVNTNNPNLQQAQQLQIEQSKNSCLQKLNNTVLNVFSGKPLTKTPGEISTKLQSALNTNDAAVIQKVNQVINLMNNSHALVKYLGTHLDAYREYAAGIKYAFFSSHKESGRENALKLFVEFNFRITQAISNEINTTLNTNPNLSVLDVNSLKQRIQKIIVDQVMLLVNNERFSGYNKHSFNHYIQHYLKTVFDINVANSVSQNDYNTNNFQPADTDKKIKLKNTYANLDNDAFNPPVITTAVLNQDIDNVAFTKADKANLETFCRDIRSAQGPAVGYRL